MSAATVGSVADAKYVMLTTYRKDGSAVSTPLWAVRDGADLVMWTVTDSWKVKRIRKNPAVLVQACDVRGKKTEGPQVAGVAEIVDGADAGQRIQRKYGILGFLTVAGSKIRRGQGGTVGIRVRDAS
ncbi:PPOX class putative F420-dependent enzyme OS=Tsukamurella paurometabola (strain ATCC 8368 / DSM/ CCUG 35730 / CIP 100753 / JCM 10117 / KCTC 9821 / NBRC 16120 / NCIMB 702349 / NCTC 13040) OX=521096 GN=Tpau_0496 PE=4 SV=1 [Tsukamurella paurometabola]|uniref:PPOX class putative F420-dependent enzyme n=1 Tax=Tsukamurella paurometabola (strain ATCC 8368 / DSM 20162 / CCUG 35730 / CIP 100753 / JCM 10117 / KCTC 9821 / NBRC 16120 / NCIMB 702349 / NCTC 13040) TaxID=521096 RepID=D5US70_TSUPD|nr:PPOX class F420-dependent oxidoreductase [Tsukamurella paurometabola]ADG77137.1 PPOX class putative F420-dependent enzyme [Tsukamurella paurometabola DSM 20162]SUP42907.1 PPOX class probable F420-dependent enzyme, Rv2061 family [Tsukamurella paurometabola]